MYFNSIQPLYRERSVCSLLYEVVLRREIQGETPHGLKLHRDVGKCLCQHGARQEEGVEGVLSGRKGSRPGEGQRQGWSHSQKGVLGAGL